MQRRALITFLGGTAVWPFVAGAQPALPVIGYLGAASPGPWAGRLAAFRRGLGEAGYVEGTNVAVEYRWASTSSCST